MADWYFRNQQHSLQKCPGCRQLVKAGQEFCPYCARRLRSEGGVRGLIKRLRAQPFIATKIILGLIVAVFVLQILAEMALPDNLRSGGRGGLMAAMASSTLTYLRMGSNMHVMVLAFSQYWRLLTYCFLHIGVIHILFNSIALWDLGRLTEGRWGGRQVFATFVLTGIAGGVASLVWNVLLRSPANSAGASGSICGLLGLLLGAYYRNRYGVGEMLGAQLMRWAVMILVFGLIIPVDNAAHIGGMISGGLLGYYLPPTGISRTRERDRKIWNAATVVSLILLVLAVGCAVVYFARGPMYAVLQGRLAGIFY
ncbi:MAG: rhomboid family intramembrane serine protease [Planctomycetes bacterium]|nr:rhomboid family intramembrane serine protease [Planctomycetota bacterium]